MPETNGHAEELIRIAVNTAWFSRVLKAVAALGLPSWCVGTRAVRNLVWDHLHGCDEPSHPADLDLAYFETRDFDPASEARLQAALSTRYPELPWEVTNQVGVHLWCE